MHHLLLFQGTVCSNAIQANHVTQNHNENDQLVLNLTTVQSKVSHAISNSFLPKVKFQWPESSGGLGNVANGIASNFFLHLSLNNVILSNAIG